MSGEPVVRVLDNPVGLVQARRRLRRKQALPVLAGWAIVGVFLVLYPAVDPGHRSSWRPSGGHARSWMLAANLLLFGILTLLSVRASSQVSATVAEDRGRGLFDLHRLTPTTPWSDALGYILGSSARELMGASILTPCFLLASSRAGFSLSESALALCLAASTGLLCQALGALIGLDPRGRNPAFHALAWVLIVVLFAQSVDRRYGAVLRHLVPVDALGSLGYFHQGPRSTWPRSIWQPSCFGLACSRVALTLVLQGTITLVLGWAVARRVASDAGPLLPRRAALGISCWVLLLNSGVSWGEVRWPGDAAQAVLAYQALGLILALPFAAAVVPRYADVLRASRARRRRSPSREVTCTLPIALGFAGLHVAGLALLMTSTLAANGTVERVAPSAELGLAVVNGVAFIAFVFGAVEYSRLVWRESSTSALALIGGGFLILPFVLGVCVQQFSSQGSLAAFFFAGSPAWGGAVSLISLAEALEGRDVTFGPASLWVSWFATVLGALAFWSAVARTRRVIRAGAPVRSDSRSAGLPDPAG